LKGQKHKTHTLPQLLAIMAKLRSSSGCPWDRQQTENTLKKYLIEESHEVLEAIEAGTPEGLKEELGDLLLQIIFLARIAEERGQFNFSDIVHTLAEKLIRRHPHVFHENYGSCGKVKPRDASEVVKVWGDMKELEGKNAGKTSLLAGLPLSLPALEHAQRMSERVSRAGFDWPGIEGVWKKVQEELGELKKAQQDPSPGAVEDELGDLLFTLVNWARFKGISAEEALRKANRRFATRFHKVEAKLRSRGRTPEKSTLQEMDHLWDEAKKQQK